MKRSLLAVAVAVSLLAMWPAYGQNSGNRDQPVQSNQVQPVQSSQVQPKNSQVAQAGVTGTPSSGYWRRNVTEDRHNLSPTGSDPGTQVPYAATRGRPPYAQGDAP